MISLRVRIKEGESLKRREKGFGLSSNIATSTKVPSCSDIIVAQVRLDVKGKVRFILGLDSERLCMYYIHPTL